MTNEIVRTIVRFPFSQNDTLISAFPIPAMGAGGPGVLITTVGGNGFSSPDPSLSTADLGAQRVALPRKCGLRAISIAPDSAIPVCDISIAARNDEYGRHRLSPGNPLLGNLDDADFMSITIPTSPPTLVAGPTVFAWDALGVPHAGGAVNIWAFPLRLEMWYGNDIPSIRADKRAPMHAAARFTLAAATQQFMYVYVEGRRQVSVEIIPHTATCTVSIQQVSYQVSTSNGGRLGGSTIASTFLFPATVLTADTQRRIDLTCFAPATGSNEINPLQMIVINVSDSAGTAATFHQVDVYAWD